MITDIFTTYIPSLCFLFPTNSQATHYFYPAQKQTRIIYHLAILKSALIVLFHSYNLFRFTHIFFSLFSFSLHSIHLCISEFPLRFNFLLDLNQIKIHYWKSSWKFYAEMWALGMSDSAPQTNSRIYFAPSLLLTVGSHFVFRYSICAVRQISVIPGSFLPHRNPSQKESYKCLRLHSHCTSLSVCLFLIQSLG